MKVALTLLQALGAFTLLPYPAVLLASVMSIAGEGPRGAQRLLIAIPYLLIALYPVFWIALYVWSWRLLGRGAVAGAFFLSLIPVVAGAAGAYFLLSDTATDRQAQEKAAREEKVRVEDKNALVWTIVCAGPRRPPGAPPVSTGLVLAAIASATKLNDAAPPYGTPMRAAVSQLQYRFDGSAEDSRQHDLERIVRALAAGGAHLNDVESKDLDLAWRQRRALFDGPITTRTENPLVWRLLEIADPQGAYVRDGKQFELHPDDRPLLNLSTRLHGTPLYTAVRFRDARLAQDLVRAGAGLSAEEASQPGVSEQLDKLLAR